MKLPKAVLDSLSHRCMIDPAPGEDTSGYAGWWHVKDDHVEHIKAWLLVTMHPASLNNFIADYRNHTHDSVPTVEDTTRFQIDIIDIKLHMQGRAQG